MIIQRTTLAQQTANHLQQEIEAGRWRGPLPGIARMAAGLGVSKATVQEAFQVLEARGMIVSHGSGKRREVAETRTDGESRRRLRVGILTSDPFRDFESLDKEIILKFTHDLAVLGHSVFHAPKSELELGLDPKRVARMISKCHADVWVIAGGSREVLAWFGRQTCPCIALGGAVGDSPIATSSMISAPAIEETLRRLIELGHKRIVMVSPPSWVRPTLMKVPRDFLEHLTRAGLPAGDYNVPYHDPTPAGFNALLESLFKLTPPTALIVENANYVFAAMAYLSVRGMSVPRDLSLVSCGPCSTFHWTRPRIAHLQYDNDFLVHRIVRWVEACAKGDPDREWKLIEASLFAGDTIAPPPRNK